MINLRVGGVPERFNYPWHRSIKNGGFEKEGIKINWTDYSGGTGAMAEALRKDEIDLALLLTEGAVSFINKGDDFKIIQVYVESPLIWGIHVPYTSSISSTDDIRGCTYAISRYGSGSHLMSYVDADKRGWDTSKLEFEIVGNMPGAVESFKNNKSQVFFWEKFTTQPLVNSNEFRRIGVCPTPWPCFVLVARNKVIESDLKTLKKVSSIILNSTNEVKGDESENEAISEMYDLDLSQVNEWKSETQWSTNAQVSDRMIQEVFETLKKLDLVDGDFEASNFIARID